MTPLQSLISSGSKLWIDSVDPDLVRHGLDWGATGATSNPIIIADLIASGRFDKELTQLMNESLDDETVAWAMTNNFVKYAESIFYNTFEATNGNDGYVSFELDPLLESEDCPLTSEERTERYIELGKQWASGNDNRMIKVPATEAGLNALEELVAAGITVNVTLLFTTRQYRAARDAVWRGALRRGSLEHFKSAYSIFVSRVDVYSQQHLPELSEAVQGMVGITNAKRIWLENHRFWVDKPVTLEQEIIFASTGTKNLGDPIDMYVAALAGSGIQTNPPALIKMIQDMDDTLFDREVDVLPAESLIEEIDQKVDFRHLEDVLMTEGLKKFADPQQGLLELIEKKRSALGVSCQPV